MNRLTFIFLIFLLSACASTQSAPEISSTESSLVDSSTFTVTPSPPPTLTETPTPKPPEGATEFNTQRGLWQNAEGKFYIPELQTWAETLNKSDIFAVDISVNPSWFKNGLPSTFQSFPINYYRLPGAEAIFSSFEQSPGYNAQYAKDEDRVVSGYTYQSAIAWHLGARANNYEVTYEDPGDANKALIAMQKGELRLPLDIPVVAHDNTKVTTKSFDPNKGVRIVQIPFSLTDGDQSYFGQLSKTFRWKLDVVDGQLVEYIALKGSFSEHNKSQLPLVPLSVALLEQQLPAYDVYPAGTDTVEADAMLHAALAQGVSFEEYSHLQYRISILIQSGALVSDNEETSGQTIPFLQVK